VREAIALVMPCGQAPLDSEHVDLVWQLVDARQQRAREEKARQQKAREEKARQQKAREEKARQQKAREENVWRQKAREEKKVRDEQTKATHAVAQRSAEEAAREPSDVETLAAARADAEAEDELQRLEALLQQLDTRLSTGGGRLQGRDTCGESRSSGELLVARPGASNAALERARLGNAALERARRDNGTYSRSPQSTSVKGSLDAVFVKAQARQEALEHAKRARNEDARATDALASSNLGRPWPISSSSKLRLTAPRPVSSNLIGYQTTSHSSSLTRAEAAVLGSHSLTFPHDTATPTRIASRSGSFALRKTTSLPNSSGLRRPQQHKSLVPRGGAPDIRID
jgi:chemotaxis protein histidine kinase CheA